MNATNQSFCTAPQTRYILGVIFLFIMTFNLLGQCPQNILVNGSMDGDLGQNSIADGWEREESSPDLNDASGVLNSTFGYTWIGDVINSSDGGSWQNLFSNEAVFQNVNLEIGADYKLCFEYAFQGIQALPNFIFDDPIGVDVSINSSLVVTTPIDVTAYTWETFCYDFIATQVQNKIEFSGSNFSYVGIDGVCISTFDCAGIMGGSAVVDECGECLEPNDPNFNQSCADCAGIPNGFAVLDECGECLELDDPNFNQSCTDCLGILNGVALLDECGECLLFNDPNFNQSCADCAGTPNGVAIIDECGECFESNDPNFNQSCIDCAGILNGDAVLDECGECLELNDPNFNQSCLDCSGIPNGLALIDECGECLEPNDPNFNQSCADCAGNPNGGAIIDECGECFEPNDPNFNQSCIDCAGTPSGTAVYNECGECLDINDPDFNFNCFDDIYFPNVFSPNDDGINDQFQVFKGSDVNAEISTYRIFSRWGELIFESNNFQFSDTDGWWKGDFKGGKVVAGVYVYSIEILFNGRISKVFAGDITVL